MYLTALWITKNEENNIGKSIDSVKDAVDEMIVVDTGSTDKTIEIAKNKGARVLHFDWIDDFAAARNFALENAKQGAVIFLDADEYFEKPLNKDDKTIITQALNQFEHVDAIVIPREDINPLNGQSIINGESSRIFRNNEQLRYKGKIHEELRKNFERVNAIFYNDLKLIHTGYTLELNKSKLERNINILEKELETLSMQDLENFEVFHKYVYAMRENADMHPEKSFEYWKSIINYPENWKHGLVYYKNVYIANLLRAIIIATQNRTIVNRKLVKKNLIELLKKECNDYWMSSLVDLIYLSNFNKNEQLFFNNFDASIEEAKNKSSRGLYEHEDEILRQLYSAAAHAASKRGQLKRAAEYAVDAIDKNAFDPENAALLSMIVDYASDKPLPEAVEILNAMYPYQETKNIRFLSEMLLREDTKDLYIFYLKYLVENDSASINEILMYSLLTGGVKNAMELARRALDSGDEEAADTVGEFMFVLMTAFNAESLYKSNPAGVAEFSRVLESYFSGKPLENITKEELAVFYTYYPYIVFLGGEEASEKFLNVFANSPLERFAALEDYNRRSRRFQAILDIDTTEIEDNGWIVKSPKIYAAIKLGKFDYALNELKTTLKDFVSFDVLNMLELLAELGAGNIQKEAQNLYDDYINRFENMVDWNDIINTDIIMDKKDVRFGKNAAKMTVKQLKQKIKDAPPKTDLSGYYEVLGNVLDKYKEQNYLGQYFNGLTELIAADINKEENKEKLKDLLKESGNEKAEEMVALI